MVPSGRWLDHLRTWLPVARKGDDPEGVHQVRTASRRLDAWLRLGGYRVLRDDLRWLRRGLSDVRDLDVLVDRELPDEVHEFLHGERKSVRPKARHVLQQDRVEALIEGLGTLPPIPEDAARAEIPGTIEVVLERGRAVDLASADTHALHDLRRGLRRLRFQLEWLGEDADDLKVLQDALGELNDRAVLVRWLDRYPEPEAISPYRAELGEELDRKRISAVQTWREAEPDVEDLLDEWTSS